MDRVTEGWMVKVNILCIYILGKQFWMEGWVGTGREEGREGGKGSEGGREDGENIDGYVNVCASIFELMS